MESELPPDIMKKGSDEIKAILTKKDASDVMWGLAKLFTNFINSLGFVPPEYKAASDVVNYVKENFGSTAAQRRQLEFLMLLFQRLNELKDRLDNEVISKEDFEIYIQRFLDNIKHEQFREKSLAFRNALVNLATDGNLNNFEVEYFVNSLISFSDLHFAIISYFNNPKEYLEKKSINLDSLKSQSGGEDGILKKLFEDVDFELIKLASKELKDKGFTTIQIPFGGGLTSMNVYERLTKDYLTPMGRKFISFFSENNLEQ